MNNNFRAGVVEALGVFLLVFAGGSAICMDVYTAGFGGGAGKVGLIGVALAHGLALSAGIYAAAGHSKAIINPAVTFGLMLIGKMRIGEAINYIIMQLIGGVLGGLAVWSLFRNMRDSSPYLGTPDLGDNVGPLQGIATEALLTFVLTIVILLVAFDAGRKARQMFGLIIGFTVTFCIFVAGPFTGAAMNPARYFGTAAVSGHLEYLGVYFAGPILGAVIASLFYKFLLETKEETPTE